MVARLDWLKEIVINLLSVVDKLQLVPNFKDVITSIITYLKMAEIRHSFTGSSRTEVKMLLSVLNSSF